MVLIIFAIIVVLEGIFLIKYAKLTLGNECIPAYIDTDEDVERIRKKLKSKFSKF